MFDYIYLLQTRESYNQGESVFKLGRTSETALKRFNQYPKGSHLKLHIDVADSQIMERKLLALFDKRFTKKEDYGNEYFEGNPDEMKLLILTECFKCPVAECPQTLDKFRREIQNYQCNATKLQENLQRQNEEVQRLSKLTDDLKRALAELRAKSHNAAAPVGVSAEEEDVNPVQCFKCNRILCNKTKLKNHLKICNGLDPLQCEICLKKFTTRQAKWNHKNSVECEPLSEDPFPPPPGNPLSFSSNPNEIRCSKCNREFTRKDHMRVHERTCNGFINPRQCEICLKVFTTAQGKWNHKNNVKCKPPSYQYL